MAFFTDNAARSWRVAIVYDDVVRVREALGLDLLQPHQSPPPPAVTSVEPGGGSVERDTLVNRLISEGPIFVNVLFVICEAQAKGGGIGDEEFGRALKGGPAAGGILQTARMALFEAWAEFFPRSSDDDEPDDRGPADQKELDIDRLVWELAGVVGVHPRDYTLRQLAHMSRGKSREAWQHTTSLMALVKTAATGKACKPSDLDPFKPRPKKRGGRRGLPLRVFIEAMVEAKQKLKT